MVGQNLEKKVNYHASLRVIDIVFPGGLSLRRNLVRLGVLLTTGKKEQTENT